LLTLSISNLAGRSYLRIERLKRARKSLLILQKKKRGAKGTKSVRKRAERATLA
jgi:hypothetical protein